MILVIDNYDSFTYNLVQYLKEIEKDIRVFRNDKISMEQVLALQPEMILISPGPSTPDNAGISLEIVIKLQGKIPILGICLGHQTIAQAFGAKIIKAKQPVHGKVHAINHIGQGVFTNVKNPLNVTRYHSLIVDKNTLPQELEVTAETRDGEIMGIRHKVYLIEGVQFHPEAILSECGHQIISNFLKAIRERISN